MTRLPAKQLKRWYKSQPDDGIARNLMATSTVALVAALIVSTAAVMLQPRYTAHRLAIRKASMSTLITSIPSIEEIVLASNADSLDTRLVDLDSGCFVSDVNVDSFDARAAESDPLLSRELIKAEGDSKTGLKRRANMALVHLLHHKDTLQLVILPVHGPGYQSTLYAWLVLAGDLNTIIALNVHEQGETPGIGSRVQDPAWQQLWSGKQLYDDADRLAITVARNGPESPTVVDGISGATRTSQGVSSMVRFWVGELGFGPMLDRLRRGEPC